MGAGLWCCSLGLQRQQTVSAFSSSNSSDSGVLIGVVWGLSLPLHMKRFVWCHEWSLAACYVLGCGIEDRTLFFASQQHSAAFMLHVLNSVLQHTDAQDAQHMTVPGASKQQACTKQQ